jgi:hypothetical protein
LGYGGNSLKRDPTIESIIESRKSVVIENAYTQLAQIKSQSFRLSQHAPNNSFKPHSMKPKTEDQIQKIENDRKVSLVLPSSTFSLDNDEWDDGLNKKFDKGKYDHQRFHLTLFIESVTSTNKSSIQVYEETCKRLNICPCSVIIRSLYTTNINLQNYGLGVKGSAALAVALIVNYSNYIHHHD